jgi:hypothetical protein
MSDFGIEKYSTYITNNFNGDVNEKFIVKITNTTPKFIKFDVYNDVSNDEDFSILTKYPLDKFTRKQKIKFINNRLAIEVEYNYYNFGEVLKKKIVYLDNLNRIQLPNDTLFLGYKM